MNLLLKVLLFPVFVPYWLFKRLTAPKRADVTSQTLDAALGKVGAAPGDRIQVVGFQSEHDGQRMLDALDRGNELLTADAAEKLFRAASRLMAEKRFEEAITQFLVVANAAPDRRADCENNVGACYFWLGRYADAINHYKVAGANGFDASMTADNIAEAREKLASA
jgi:tetratricopeptide (TPR) repeat protein